MRRPRGPARRPAEQGRLRADGAGLLRAAARRRPAARRSAASLGRAVGEPDAAGPPRGRPVRGRAAGLPVADLREFVLKPNLPSEHQAARPGRPTRWGCATARMRRRSRRRTFRIALVGDSIAAGWGVDDGQGFEPTLERALDARSRAAGGPAVEVLNFAVPGHGPGQRWDHFAPARLGDRTRPGDLRGDPGRRRLGRAPAPRAAAPGRRLGLAASTATCWPRPGSRPGGDWPRPTSGRSGRSAASSWPGSTARSPPTAGPRACRASGS